MKKITSHNRCVLHSAPILSSSRHTRVGYFRCSYEYTGREAGRQAGEPKHMGAQSSHAQPSSEPGEIPKHSPGVYFYHSVQDGSTGMYAVVDSQPTSSTSLRFDLLKAIWTGVSHRRRTDDNSEGDGKSLPWKI